MGRTVGSIVTLLLLVTMLVGAAVPAGAIGISHRGGEPGQGKGGTPADSRGERGHGSDEKHPEPERRAGDERQTGDPRREGGHRVDERGENDERRENDGERRDDVRRARDRGPDDERRGHDRRGDDEADAQRGGRARNEQEDPTGRGRGGADGRTVARPGPTADRGRPTAADPTPSRGRDRGDDVAPPAARTDGAAAAAPDVGSDGEAEAAPVPDPRSLRLLGLGGYLTGGPEWWGSQPDSGPLFGVPGLPSTIGGLPVLLALLGAFLALQRGIGSGLGHVPMDPTSPEPETHAHR